jgi:endonuclease/exonuclease/phosphatase family metal-dependent hydrolase
MNKNISWKKMKKNKIMFLLFVTILFILLILFFIFLSWNESPKIPKRYSPNINTLNIESFSKDKKDIIKVVSYNIHFAIGLDEKTNKINKSDYENRLNDLASVISTIDADIVLLQEVDINSKRSHFINQGEYIAKKAKYNYFIQVPTLKNKIHIFFNKIIGNIETGMAILSRYPILDTEAYIFEHSEEVPFFAKWLYDPHGAMKCLIQYNNKKIKVINLHLDPWSQQNRESQIEKIKKMWLYDLKKPTIIGGDFNSIDPYDHNKKGLYLYDAPWFINKKNWNLKKETTISTLLRLGFRQANAFKLYLNQGKLFTFPANDPKEKIDYIFSGFNTRMITGYVFKKAKTASDHLPVIADIKIHPKSSG